MQRGERFGIHTGIDRGVDQFGGVQTGRLQTRFIQTDRAGDFASLAAPIDSSRLLIPQCGISEPATSVF
jgi:hypothetical protein